MGQVNSAQILLEVDRFLKKLKIAGLDNILQLITCWTQTIKQNTMGEFQNKAIFYAT